MELDVILVWYKYIMDSLSDGIKRKLIDPLLRLSNVVSAVAMQCAKCVISPFVLRFGGKEIRRLSRTHR